MFYAHGDVLLKKIEKLPEGKKLETNVIMEGEHTGHMHRIIGDAQIFECDGKRYVWAENSFDVVHEEHRQITIKPGIYEIDRQKEYDPYDEIIREVQD